MQSVVEYNHLTLLSTESSYPPILVDTKNIQKTYYDIIYANIITTVYKKR